jgi:hypothetical protein
MQQTWFGQIADVDPVASKKTPILEALDGTADIAVRNYLGLLYTMRVQIPDHMIGAEHGNKQQGNETS